MQFVREERAVKTNEKVEKAILPQEEKPGFGIQEEAKPGGPKLGGCVIV